MLMFLSEYLWLLVHCLLHFQVMLHTREITDSCLGRARWSNTVCTSPSFSYQEACIDWFRLLQTFSARKFWGFSFATLVNYSSPLKASILHSCLSLPSYTLHIVLEKQFVGQSIQDKFLFWGDDRNHLTSGTKSPGTPRPMHIGIRIRSQVELNRMRNI